MMTQHEERTSGARIEDVMIEDVVTIGATATLAEAAGVMREANVGMLPVMNGENLLGVVTDRDLVIRGMAQDVKPSSVQVSECMSTNVIAVPQDAPVERAMEIMAHEQIGRLPVIDANGKLIGVVTLSSLALRSSQQGETLEAAQEVSRRSARAA
jgi:CBS domain-containing protein